VCQTQQCPTLATVRPFSLSIHDATLGNNERVHSVNDKHNDIWSERDKSTLVLAAEGAWAERVNTEGGNDRPASEHRSIAAQCRLSSKPSSAQRAPALEPARPRWAAVNADRCSAVDASHVANSNDQISLEGARRTAWLTNGRPVQLRGRDETRRRQTWRWLAVTTAAEATQCSTPSAAAAAAAGGDS